MSHPLRRSVIAIWLLVLLVLALYSGWRILAGTAFESNILGMIPGATATATPDRALHRRFERRFLILLSTDDKRRGGELAGQLRDRIDRIEQISSGDEAGEVLTALKGFYRPYRHQLLTPEWRQRLEQPPEQLARSVFRQLHSPLGGFRPYSFAEDPFNLGGAWLESLLPSQRNFRGGDIPSIEKGDATWHLISGSVADSPFALAPQRALTTAVDDFERRHPSATLLRSGVVFHAAEASRLARREITTVGVGSLAAIILLVALIFRSRRHLLAIVFTLTSGTILALAASLAVFDRVHLITLAFGSTLLGLAVDYCFHFLVRYQRHGDALTTGRAIARGLVISAGSSIAVYLIQLFSPFSGLHQFAVFMSAGLVGAGCSVGVLSLWFRDRSPRTLTPWLALYPRRLAPWYARMARHRYKAVTALTVLAAAMTLSVFSAGTRDDIRALNASSPELTRSEERVHTLLESPDPQRYFRVEATDTQTLLARTERLVSTLATEADNVQAITRFTPPLVVQRADYQRIAERLYGEDGALEHLCRLLQTDCEQWRDFPGSFQSGLVPAALPERFETLWPALATTTATSTQVWPGSGTTLERSPKELAASLPGVDYIDQVARISGAMADYRQQITRLLGVFVAVFVGACLLLYGRSAVTIVGSLGLALAVGLGSAAAGGITLFHMLALLLVVGLAVDTAVFYRELGLGGDTWLAASMATVTSILAFGLLSLSRVPVLHHFGSVVFAGLLCTWLLTPLIFNLRGWARPPTPPDKGYRL